MKVTVLCAIVAAVAFRAVPAGCQTGAANDLVPALFFGRLPGARAEGMGRSGAAAAGGASGHFFNPAYAALAGGISLSATRAQPFYRYKDARYLFIGLTFNQGSYGAFGISRWRFDTGNTPQSADRWKASWYTISYAFKAGKGGYCGLSLNTIQQEMTGGGSGSAGADQPFLAQERSSFFMNAGLVKLFTWTGAGRSTEALLISAGFTNLSGAHLSYTNRDILRADTAVPSILRLGLSFTGARLKNSPSRKEVVRLISLAEYYCTTRDRSHAGINLGAEISLYSVCSVRAGYCREKTGNAALSGASGVYSGATWGFGIEVPVNRLTGNRLSCTMKLDYAHLAEPADAPVKQTGGAGAFHVISVNVGW